MPAYRRISALWLLMGSALCTMSAESFAAEPEEILAGFARTQLVVTAADRHCILFDVYVAANAKQRSRGLMFVQQMDLYEGMIFLYPRAQVISMWMKNTLLPLDMLFFDSSGKLVSLHANAVPQSTSIIESLGAVNTVLELNGGAADYFDIRPGDQIVFPYTLTASR